MTAVILGCGYTGTRVANLMAQHGVRVIAATRDPERIRASAVEVVALDITGPVDLSFVPKGSSILYSIPVTSPDATLDVLSRLHDRASRLVYLSTTSVYGPVVNVDETTPVDPVEPSARKRVAGEQEVLKGPWSGLVLRPAAIYGPGRGVHVRIRRGDHRLVGDGSNFVSRIHVADLATHVVAALSCTVTGAYPVADDHSCTSREIAEFCAELLGIPIPIQQFPEDVLHHTLRANRRVNGEAIRKLLGVTLQFRSYRTGIPASLVEENTGVS